MKILLTSVGTRGDMEPFLAVGQILQTKGHDVLCAFPAQFRDITLDSGLEFESLGFKFIELIESESGKNAMGGASGINKIAGTIKLAMNQKEANKELVYMQEAVVKSFNPDRIIYNSKAVYPRIWELDHPGASMLLTPLPYMHFVTDHAHVAFDRNLGKFLNKLTYKLANFGLYTTIKMANKWLSNPGKINKKPLYKILEEGKTIYSISPSLFRRPEEWHQNLQVLGYYQRKSKGEVLEQKVNDFLAKHEKVLFISFGSMINASPEAKTGIIIRSLTNLNIPAIINVAGGGLIIPDSYDKEMICFVEGVPYEELFPKIYAVIHHGGSGTTHLGLKHGCPSLIIPHIIDQFIWNSTIASLGAGPKGPSIQKLSIAKLSPLLEDLFSNNEYLKNAQQIRDQMKKEELEGELLSMVESI